MESFAMAASFAAVLRASKSLCLCSRARASSSCFFFESFFPSAPVAIFFASPPSLFDPPTLLSIDAGFAAFMSGPEK